MAMTDAEFRESMAGLMGYLEDAQKGEGERQMKMLAALDRLKGVIQESLRKCFPNATDKEITFAALTTMVAMVEDGRIQVYLLPEPTDV